MNKYYASTKEEIINKSLNLLTRIHIKHLFTHQGEIQITDKAIILKDWKTIEWNDIKKVDMENDEIVSSKMFATQSRLFFMKSSKPIRLILNNNEVIYLYVNWNFATGLSDNKKIYERIKNN